MSDSVRNVYQVLKAHSDRAKSYVSSIQSEKKETQRLSNESSKVINAMIEQLYNKLVPAITFENLQKVSDSIAREYKNKLSEIERDKAELPAKSKELKNVMDLSNAKFSEASQAYYEADKLYEPTLGKFNELKSLIDQHPEMEKLNNLARSKNWHISSPGFLTKFFSQDYEDWKNIKSAVSELGYLDINSYLLDLDSKYMSIKAMKSDIDTKLDTKNKTKAAHSVNEQAYASISRKLETLSRAKVELDDTTKLKAKLHIERAIVDNDPKFMNFEEAKAVALAKAKANYASNINSILDKELKIAEKVSDKLEAPLSKLYKHRSSSKRVSFDASKLKPLSNFFDGAESRFKEKRRLLAAQRSSVYGLSANGFSSRYNGSQTTYVNNKYDSGWSFSDYYLYWYLFNNMNNNDACASAHLLNGSNMPELNEIGAALKSDDLSSGVPSIDTSVLDNIQSSVPDIGGIDLDKLGLGEGSISIDTPSFDFDSMTRDVDSVSSVIDTISSEVSRASCSSSTSSCRSSCSSSPGSSCSSSSSGSSCGSSCGGGGD